MKLKSLSQAALCLAALALLLFPLPPTTMANEDTWEAEEAKRVVAEYFTARAAGQPVNTLFCLQKEGFEIPLPEHYTILNVQVDEFETRARVLVRQTVWIFAVRIRADRSCIQTLTHE